MPDERSGHLVHLEHMVKTRPSGKDTAAICWALDVINYYEPDVLTTELLLTRQRFMNDTDKS